MRKKEGKKTPPESPQKQKLAYVQKVIQVPFKDVKKKVKPSNCTNNRCRSGTLVQWFHPHVSENHRPTARRSPERNGNANLAKCSLIRTLQ